MAAAADAIPSGSRRGRERKTASRVSAITTSATPKSPSSAPLECVGDPFDHHGAPEIV